MGLVKFYDLHICTWHARLHVVMTNQFGRYWSPLREAYHLAVIATSAMNWYHAQTDLFLMKKLSRNFFKS